MCPNTQDIKGTHTPHDLYPSSECTGTVALGPYSIILLHKTISSVQEAILIWLALILSQSFQHFWSLKLNIRFLWTSATFYYLLSKTTHLRYDELTKNIFLLHLLIYINVNSTLTTTTTTVIKLIIIIVTLNILKIIFNI